MQAVKKILLNKYFIFIVAFTIMFIYLLPLSDLTGGTSDAAESINVIKTFFATNKYHSYVMYKGIYAFLPGVLCYNIANCLNISWLLLMKIFHSLGFAYISTIGMPYLIEHLFNKKSTIIQKYIFILLFFIMEFENFVYISVDFCSAALLILCINSIIKIISEKETKLKRIIITGLLLGICTCLSGQFLPSAVVLIIYFLYLIIKKNIYNKKTIIVLFLFLFIFSLLITKGIDKLYEAKVITPYRESGNWLPTGSEWISSGFTANMLIVNYPRMLPDNLGLGLIQKENIDYDRAYRGEAIFHSKRDMISMILKYPALFCIRWTERLYLGLINDNSNYVVKPRPGSLLLNIIFMTTVVYAFWLECKNKFKKISNIFSFDMLIIISFILSALVPSIGHVENRYYLAMRTLILGVFCLSPYLPRVVNSIRDFFKKYKNETILNYKINYNVVTYFIFVVLSVLIYAALYQNFEPNTFFMYNIFK